MIDRTSLDFNHDSGPPPPPQNLSIGGGITKSSSGDSYLQHSPIDQADFTLQYHYVAPFKQDDAILRGDRSSQPQTIIFDVSQLMEEMQAPRDASNPLQSLLSKSILFSWLEP